eukprot:1589610-Amphidinium_carterae.1
MVLEIGRSAPAASTPSGAETPTLQLHILGPGEGGLPVKRPHNKHAKRELMLQGHRSTPCVLNAKACKGPKTNAYTRYPPSRPFSYQML